MKPGRYDITLYEGANWDITFTWKNPDGTPVNLTGYIAKLEMRRAPGDGDVFLARSSAAGTIVLGGVAGTIQVLATAVETANVDFMNSDYDLKMTSPGGVTYRLLYGKVKVSEQVTV